MAEVFPCFKPSGGRPTITSVSQTARPGKTTLVIGGSDGKTDIISFDGVVSRSWPFRIGDDLLWAETSRPAYRFFYYQRCGMAIPGFHGACHLDDAVGRTSGKQYELWGG